MNGRDVTGKVAIVTGGGRGLGKEMAVALARAGASVVAASYSAADNEAMDALGIDGLHTALTDITDADACRSLIDGTVERFGHIDALINNAGLLFTYIYPDRFRRDTTPKFWECTDEVVQNVINTNFVGHERMSRLAVAHMIPRGSGQIINVTTMIETMTKPGSGPYGPSKAALEMASEIWMKDLEGTGVRVNILNPGGPAETDGFANEEDRDLVRHRMNIVPAERMAAPTVWLVSDDAVHINGMRYDAGPWDPDADPAGEAARIGRPLGFNLKPRAGE